MGIVWLAAIAPAAEPSVEVTESGSVRGRVVVSTIESDVRAILADPERRIEVTNADVEMTSTVDGDCTLEDVTAPHVIKTVRYVVRSCPTDDGFQMTLISSEDLSRFEATWTLSEIDAGTEIVYDLDVMPSFPVPGFIARASKKRAVLKVMTALAQNLER